MRANYSRRPARCRIRGARAENACHPEERTDEGPLCAEAGHDFSSALRGPSSLALLRMTPFCYALTLLRSYALTLLRSYALTLLRSYALTLLRSYALTLLRSYARGAGYLRKILS